MTSHMQYYTFSIQIAGIKRITDELENKIWEAGCIDSLISVKKGVVSLDFTRQDPSMARAIGKASLQIESVVLDDGTRLSISGLYTK